MALNSVKSGDSSIGGVTLVWGTDDTVGVIAYLSKNKEIIHLLKPYPEPALEGKGEWASSEDGAFVAGSATFSVNAGEAVATHMPGKLVLAWVTESSSYVFAVINYSEV